MIFTKKLRVAAAGALALALAVGMAPTAHAAPGDVLNPQANGSKGSFFLYDENFVRADVDPATVFTRSTYLSGSASPTDFLAELNPAATRSVTGATAFTGAYKFLSDKTPAARDGGTNTWKAFASEGTGVAGPNGGTLMPELTLNALTNGIDTVVAAGGSYWYGIAYTTNNGVTTVGAVYREINITAGSGNYTVGPVEVVPPQVVNTDIATTTTLAASPTSVEAGSTTVLTATVSASKALPASNVEFYNGATKIATGAVANGIASYTATVGTVGANTFSAKYVENVVSTSTTTTDTFKASASADVTVTGTTPAVTMPPKGPSDNALNSATANGATAIYDAGTHKVTLSNIPAAAEGTVVNAFAYSSPTYVGSPTVTSGAISVSVSTLALGNHSLAITNTATGDVIAWAAFNKTDAAISPTFSKQINADVINGQTLADGEFSLTNDSAAVVNLTNPTLVNGESVVSGQLGKFHVTDLRQVTKPGWNLTTTVNDFTHTVGTTTDTIAKKALGITPTLISNAGTGASAPNLGTALVSGNASYPWDFAVLAAGGFSGVNTYNAGLIFTAPAGSPAGTYTSTLTLTLISK